MKEIKYSQMTDGLTNLTHKVSLVMTMVGDVSKEYLATFNRRLETQFYNELRRDYAFPRAVCRVLSELLVTYLDLYSGGQGKEGQVIFQAVSKDVPPWRAGGRNAVSIGHTHPLRTRGLLVQDTV